MAKSQKTSLIPLGISLVVLGFLFLLENLDIINGVHRFWPIFPLMAGLGFLILFNYNKKESVLAGIGTLIISTSGLFFYLNFTSWKQMAFLWPLFIIFFGLSFLSIYLSCKKSIYLYLSLAFMAIGLVFFLIFSVNAKLWPISLLLLGASMIILTYSSKKK